METMNRAHISEMKEYELIMYRIWVRVMETGDGTSISASLALCTLMDKHLVVEEVRGYG